MIRDIIDENRIVSGPNGDFRRSAKLMMLVSLLILFFPAAAVGDSAGVFNRKIPFPPGEKLTYEGKWGPIPAGHVTLEVLPRKTIDGIEAHHFAMTTRTNTTVDLLYKVRERQDSFVDSGLTRSILYTKRTESKHPRDIIVNFYWDRREATYTNFGQKSPPIGILPGSFDPLALIYIVRLQALAENVVIELPVTDGRMNFAVKATILRKDAIEIRGKVYPAFEATIDMEDLDKFVKKSEDPYLKIWYSADERKVPLRIESKVGIISFGFELVAIAP